MLSIVKNSALDGNSRRQRKKLLTIYATKITPKSISVRSGSMIYMYNIKTLLR